MPRWVIILVTHGVVYIYSSQDLLRLGCRWEIGDGTSIRVWEEPWIRCQHPVRLTNPHILGADNLKVADLMLPGQRAWNEPFIRSMFSADVVEKILGTPLFPMTEDTLLWNQGPKGMYTVRTAYFLCHSVSSQDTRRPGRAA